MGKNLLRIATIICSFSILCIYGSAANANPNDVSSSNILANYYNDDPEMTPPTPNVSDRVTTTKTTKVTKSKSSSSKKVKRGKKGKKKVKKRNKKPRTKTLSKNPNNKNPGQKIRNRAKRNPR